MLTKDHFAQKVPCQDCPFRKDGGVRHGDERMLDYASYFLLEPGVTFPCHKSVPPSDDRADWSAWQDGQVLCAGGLLFAAKHGIENGVVRAGRVLGYDPAAHTADQLALVFDDLDSYVRGDDGL